MHHLAAAAMLAAAKLSSDEKSLMVDVYVALGHRAQDNPILRVPFRHGFAVFVDFMNRIKLLKAVERPPEVLGHFARIIVGPLERQLAEFGERVLEISVVHQLASLLPLVR